MTPRTGSGDHYVAWLWRNLGKRRQAKREGHKAITLVRFWPHLRNLGNHIYVCAAYTLVRLLHTYLAIHGLVMHYEFNLIY